MPLTKKDINSIKNYFADKPVLKAYLFGSYARNESNEESDVDILVDLDYNQHIGLNFIRYHLDLQNLLKKKVDLVSSKGVSPRIKSFIDRDKQLIYEK